MKKIIVLSLLLLIAGVYSFSQKKNGTIYSEHEAIDKTRELWKALVNGDEVKFRSFFADSAYIINNDQPSQKTANADIGKGLAYWKNNFENFSVADQKPAYPDALEYKEGGIWVQDWLIATGIHKETGVVLNLPVHNMYRFNDEGKITIIVRYFNNYVFEEIAHSQTTRENGDVYINHPYIVTVRKAMNAFMAKDFEKWASFFTPNARFSSITMPVGESMSLEEYKELLTSMYVKEGMKYRVEQVGYPDCIYYEESNQYVVYSWWRMIIDKKDFHYEFPVMLSSDFNDEGKIVRLNVYVSSNHLEKF
jgi:hypothetical protein